MFLPFTGSAALGSFERAVAPRPLKAMKILCAWCGKVIAGRGASISHGICRRCFQDYFQTHFGFMDSLPIADVRRGTRSRQEGTRSAREQAMLLQPSLFA
jgi:hypothetical protein